MSRQNGSAKPKRQLTHFLCLPLITPTSKQFLRKSLEEFTSSVNGDVDAVGNSSSAPQDHGRRTVIVKKAIRPLSTLHCTLGVMSLDKDKLDTATNFLKSLDLSSMLHSSQMDSAEVVNDSESTASLTPLSVNLKGLESMHSPQATSVLYTAPSDISGRLFPFCMALQKAFVDEGLLIPEERPLKLHATIVNTIYAREKPNRPNDRVIPKSGENIGQARERHNRSKRTGPVKIDSRGILERYREYVWADNIVLDRLAICEMGATRVIDSSGDPVDEEYTEVASVPLPYASAATSTAPGLIVIAATG